ncbi:unnamed protein product [Parascedosporium putredinis]|uniref:DUF5672 domain-containing protein n=1 Tax=Parascedosporium putredinis TaxID=1442378 RepID=A0A9P1MEK6_9PEZI|nr:unnamed protein product [Parascedosporium putredinis]CAI8000724.1 unnamed protein product [Parascedosporium putredinis]
MAVITSALRPQLMGASQHITRVHILVVFSLIFTWFIAGILPHYTPNIQSQLANARQKIPQLKVDWKVEQDPRAKWSSQKVALLIEPRPLPHLIAGKLDLMVLPAPWSIASKEHVYRTLTDPRFYDEFLPGIEWILKYEADSIMCANSGESLNEWLDWSWAGAPRSPDDRFSGNGGLSLRRVSAIQQVLGFQQRFNDSGPEDEWFGKRLWVLPNHKVASGSDGRLAVEDVYFENAMGYHVREGKDTRDEVWKSYDQRKKIFEYCPELSMIMDMKLERERCDWDTKQTPPEGKSVDEWQAEMRKKMEEEEKRAADAKVDEEKKKNAALAEKAQHDAEAKNKLDGGAESSEEDLKKLEEEKKKLQEALRKMKNGGDDGAEKPKETPADDQSAKDEPPQPKPVAEAPAKEKPAEAPAS